MLFFLLLNSIPKRKKVARKEGSTVVPGAKKGSSYREVRIFFRHGVNAHTHALERERAHSPGKSEAGTFSNCLSGERKERKGLSRSWSLSGKRTFVK